MMKINFQMPTCHARVKHLGGIKGTYPRSKGDRAIMLKLADRRSFVRAAHSSWPDDCDMTPRYNRHINIDPSRTLEAWGTLAEDTFPLEIATYPAIIHRAFRLHLFKRSKNES